MSLNIAQIIASNVETLSEKDNFTPVGDLHSLPSVEALCKVVELTRSIIFPGYFGSATALLSTLKYQMGANMEQLYILLKSEVRKGLTFDGVMTTSKAVPLSEEIAATFINSIKDIKALLIKDIEAVYNNDPAAKSYGEVVFSYPGVTAITYYRIANKLLQLGVPIIPRIISEAAHSQTGIDIHPASQIGDYFSIDHGTGVVIGQTCIIGSHVHLYQGVTLGAKNFTLDENGHPLDLPRHPIIEDRVTIYSGASILGRITIGHDSVVGGNMWITNDLPPFSKVTQATMNCKDSSL